VTAKRATTTLPRREKHLRRLAQHDPFIASSSTIVTCRELKMHLLHTPGQALWRCAGRSYKLTPGEQDAGNLELGGSQEFYEMRHQAVAVPDGTLVKHAAKEMGNEDMEKAACRVARTIANLEAAFCPS